MIDHAVLLKAAQDLAPLPAAVVRLAALVAKGTYSAGEVEAIVRLDAPLTLRLLQYANSAASASHIRIGTVREAVMRVGVGPILSYATASTLRPLLVRAIPAYGLSEGDLWRHSVAGRRSPQRSSLRRPGWKYCPRASRRACSMTSAS